ncbi:MAG: hypothetical protein Q4C34_02170 [Bacteroidales bacterium]|nr:hypothetical protein [Bacteroidales bacterium]
MKKKFLTAALVIATICGVPAMAQKQTKCPQYKGNCPQPEQCDSTSCTCDNDNNGGRHRGGNPYREIFAGLNLTTEQQTALDALKPARPERGQRRDSTATRPDPRQARRDYLAGVKQILTPEQYVVFLENVVVEQGTPGVKGHRNDMRRKEGRRQDLGQTSRHRNGDRKHAKARKGDRQARTTEQQSHK